MHEESAPLNRTVHEASPRRGLFPRLGAWTSRHARVDNADSPLKPFAAPRRWFRGGPMRGHAFFGAVTSLLSMAIFVPPTAHFLETRRQLDRPARRSSTALALAEAGVRRGMRKLGESDLVWQKARWGTEIPHFNNDVNFSDERGGSYRLRLVPGPSPRDVTVISTGRDEGTGETRTLRAVFTKDGMRAALETQGDLALGPTLRVQWGPVVAHGNILTGRRDPFPRKFTAGHLVAWNSNETMGTDLLVNDRTLGPAPRLDFAYYRDRAKMTHVPMISSNGGRLEWGGEGPWPALADPPESGYFLASKNNGQGIRFRSSPDGRPYTLSDPTAVILIENDTPQPIETRLSANGANLEIEALILIGKANHLRLAAQKGTFRAALPPRAAEEYGAEAAAAWAPFAPLLLEPGRCCQGIANAGLRGLVWVEGNLLKKDDGPLSILGTVQVGGTMETRHLSIYYDEATALNARTDGESIYRADWQEITAVN